VGAVRRSRPARHSEEPNRKRDREFEVETGDNRAAVSQVVLLAKHYAGAGWRTLSIPRRQPAGS
jgi:hypothetical protein